MGRFKRFTRWEVYACTLIALVITAISFVFVIGASVSKVRREQILLYREVSVRFEKGRIDLGYIPRGGYGMFGPPLPEPGWHARTWSYRTSYFSYPKGSIFAPKYQWWSLPGYTRGHGNPTGPTYEISIPLVYVSLILSSLSVWMWIRVWRKSRLGRCRKCGYSVEGLTSNTCPECGVERG